MSFDTNWNNMFIHIEFWMRWMRKCSYSFSEFLSFWYCQNWLSMFMYVYILCGDICATKQNRHHSKRDQYTYSLLDHRTWRFSRKKKRKKRERERKPRKKITMPCAVFIYTQPKVYHKTGSLFVCIALFVTHTHTHVNNSWLLIMMRADRNSIWFVNDTEFASFSTSTQSHVYVCNTCLL